MYGMAPTDNGSGPAGILASCAVPATGYVSSGTQLPTVLGTVNWFSGPQAWTYREA
jgi:hypothetical protein